MEIFSALPVTGEIPRTNASDAERWCFFFYLRLKKNEYTIEKQVIWDAIGLIMMSL